MSVLKKARLAMRESNDMAKLLTLPPDERSVVVYAEDTFSYIQLKGYLTNLWQQHQVGFQYVTSDPEDPLLSDPPAGASVWFVRDQLQRLMSSLECQLFITTMPDLGRFHVPRPKTGRTLYVFHSLNSTHTAYRSGAFDHYDSFLCTGPHHVDELSALRRGSQVELYETGYYKLDLVAEEYEEINRTGGSEDDLVVVAPSWGPSNLLESVGIDVVRSLRDTGLRVIVRPHPQFFHSLYPEGAGVIAEMQRVLRKDRDVTFELSIDSQDSFSRSALMVSDWSGAAYEFALGTMRPVLFVDTPQKVFNPDWETLGLPSFERIMRAEVGAVIGIDEPDRAGTEAGRLIASEIVTADDFRRMREEKVYNFAHSAAAGAEAIANSL